MDARSIAKVTHMLKQRIKNVLIRHSPRMATTMLSIRSRRMQERQARDLGLASIAVKIAQTQGLVCTSGPFAGMSFPPEVLARHFGPKLLGTYEHELHDLLNNVLRRPYQQIINIGCAEGYYAIGFAMQMPHTEVFAFDTDPVARRITRKLAALNKCTERVRIGGFVNSADFEQLLDRGKSLVLMDCEGCEADLLDLDKCPSLTRADIIAELHEEIVEDLEHVLRRRFNDTHEVVVLRSEPRRRGELPAVQGVNEDELLLAIDERRASNSKWMAFLRSVASKATRPSEQGMPPRI